MAVLFTNNAATTLSVSANPSDLTLTVKAGDGVLFPLPANAGDWFPVTLVKQDGQIEICRCTGRSSDTLTVQRSQEGTPALSWSPNERVELRLTAAALAEFVQQSVESYVRAAGGAMTLTESAGKVSIAVDGDPLGTLATEEGIRGKWETGMRIGFTGTTAPSGWVMGCGRTIGGPLSGATERANADTAALYTLLWNSYSNTELPIQDSAGTPTTRGANASADFAANKRLPTPDYRGRVAAGKDDMGGTSANRLTAALNGDTLGATGGAETHTLTSGQMPSHSHGVTDPGHTHTTAQPSLVNANLGGAVWASGTDGSPKTDNINSATTGISIQDAGSGEAHNNTQPTIVELVIIKL